METQSSAIVTEVNQHKLIKLPQLIIMTMANKHLAGIKLSDLVRVTGASASTVTMAKQKLIEEGLVVEHYPTRDRRTAKLYLSAEGQALAAAYWRLVRDLATLEDQVKNTATFDCLVAD